MSFAVCYLGTPQTPYGTSRGQQVNLQVQKLSNPYDIPTPVKHRKRCFSFGGFFSCLVLLFLFVLVLLSLACPFLSVALSVWLCLVVAVLGCCVRRCVLFLGLSAGAVLLLVLARSAFAFVVSRLVGCVVWVRPGWCSVSGFVWFVSVPVVR